MEKFFKSMFPSGRIEKDELSFEMIMKSEEKKVDISKVSESVIQTTCEEERPEKTQQTRKERREAERLREKLKQKEEKESRKREAKKRELAQNLDRIKTQTATEIRRNQVFAPEVQKRLEKIAFNL